MKKIKITDSQRIMLEVKAAAKLQESNYSQSGSKAVTDAYKQAGANKIEGMKVEGVEMPTEEIQMSELAPKVLEFIKQLYLNPSKDSLDPFWASVDVTWDELIQLLTELTLIKSAASGYRLQRLERVGGPTAVVRIVTKLVHKLINDKKAPVEEDLTRQQSNKAWDDAYYFSDAKEKQIALIDKKLSTLEKGSEEYNHLINRRSEISGIIKSKFNDPEYVKQYDAGVSMGEVEEKDINADYFKKQIGEPKKTGKTRAELLAVIAQKKAEEQKRREAENNRPIGEERPLVKQEKNPSIPKPKRPLVKQEKNPSIPKPERPLVKQEKNPSIPKPERPLVKQEKNPALGELEEDNLPLGAGQDSSAPFNQVDPPEGRRPEQETLNLEVYADDLALFSKDGSLFVYNVESADSSEYEEYASRGETPMGRDEHGDMQVEYGDWEVDGDIVNAYVNDNIEHLSIGKGLDAHENGVDLVEVDQALAQDLLSLAKYMGRDPKMAQRWVQVLNSVNIEETTGAASSGAFVGTLGAGGSKPIHKSNVASEIRGVIDEDMDGSLKSEILTIIEPFVNTQLDPELLMSYWLNNETKLKEVIDKIQKLGDDEWKLMFEFIIGGLQGAEMHIQQKDASGMGNFKHKVDGLINFVNHFSSNLGEATTVGSVGGDSGTFAYDAPVGDGGNFWTAGNKMAKKMPLVKKGGVNEMIAREGKDAKTDTQWPGGHFVEFDDCTKLNNNKVAQNGGCSTGAVDGVVKTRSSKNSVISDSSIYEAIANETGRTIDEVKSILDRKNNKSK